MKKEYIDNQRQRRYVLLTVLAVMVVSLVAALWICSKAAKAERHVRYVGMMRVTSERLSKTIRGVEMNAKNVFDEVGKHLDSPESVIAALESKTSLNPDVKGYFAAFEPNHFPEKGRWFEPYVHHSDSGSFEVNQVGSARHDYTKSEWYVRAVAASGRGTSGDELEMCFWSEPYYYQDNDEIGISGHYCTFITPIMDANNRLVCVCGADMTLEWLGDELKRIDESNRNDSMLNRFKLFGSQEFYSIIVNKDGSCVAHPDGKRVPLTDEQVISDLAQKKSGVADLTVNGVPSIVYYGPIDHIDWSVAVIVKK